MTLMQNISQRVKNILGATMDLQIDKSIFKINRVVQLFDDSGSFDCPFKHSITFERLQKNGCAFNHAEIFLLPQEYSNLETVLEDHPRPFIGTCRQYTGIPSRLFVCYIEAYEPPIDFAERISNVLTVLE